MQYPTRSPYKYGNHRTDTISGFVHDKYLVKNQKIIEAYEEVLNDILSP